MVFELIVNQLSVEQFQEALRLLVVTPKMAVGLKVGVIAYIFVDLKALCYFFGLANEIPNPAIVFEDLLFLLFHQLRILFFVVFNAALF